MIDDIKKMRERDAPQRERERDGDWREPQRRATETTAITGVSQVAFMDKIWEGK
jgi:hypothetical protein